MFLGDNIIIFPMMGDLLELYVFSPNLGFVLLVLPTPRLPLYPCAYGISYFKNIKIMNSNSEYESRTYSALSSLHA